MLLNKERVREYLMRMHQRKAIILCDGKYYFVELHLINDSFYDPGISITAEEFPLTTLSKDFLSITPDMYF